MVGPELFYNLISEVTVRSQSINPIHTQEKNTQGVNKREQRLQVDPWGLLSGSYNSEKLCAFHIVLEGEESKVKV